MKWLKWTSNCNTASSSCLSSFHLTVYGSLFLCSIVVLRSQNVLLFFIRLSHTYILIHARERTYSHTRLHVCWLGVFTVNSLENCMTNQQFSVLLLLLYRLLFRCICIGSIRPLNEGYITLYTRRYSCLAIVCIASVPLFAWFNSHIRTLFYFVLARETKNK